MSHIIIIGGGASGLMAALSAARAAAADSSVTLLERQARVGRKLAASGNGRCNLSNQNALPPQLQLHYHGIEPDFCRPALSAFGPRATLEFLAGLGLLTATEADGRVYPFSDTANSVCDVLRLSLEQDGSRLVCGAEAVSARREPASGDFVVQARLQEEGRVREQVYRGQRLIVACGGLAGARLGGCGDGYRLLQGFGHQRSPLYPALTQIKTDNRLVRPLKGVRAAAALTLLDGEQKPLVHSQGEVQFTDFGVSGPAAFELSRAVSCRPGQELSLRLDLLPQLSREELLQHLCRRRQAFPRLTADHLLTGSLHNRLGLVLCRQAGLEPGQPLDRLSREQLARLCALVKAWGLPVGGVLGFEAAQVTAGGVLTRDFDPQTLESRLAPGLYACGEVLDIDGDCGGYNLQWAWSSGYLAGRAAASRG